VLRVCTDVRIWLQREAVGKQIGRQVPAVAFSVWEFDAASDQTVFTLRTVTGGRG